MVAFKLAAFLVARNRLVNHTMISEWWHDQEVLASVRQLKKSCFHGKKSLASAGLFLPQKLEFLVQRHCHIS